MTTNSNGNDFNNWLNGALYFFAAALTPLQAIYSTDAAISTRNVIAAIISGLIAGFAALKAYRSTGFADAGGGSGGSSAPKEVIVANTEAAPVPTLETPAPSPITKRTKKVTV
jgi:uncharacterized membrane-anchored protein